MIDGSRAEALCKITGIIPTSALSGAPRRRVNQSLDDRTQALDSAEKYGRVGEWTDQGPHSRNNEAFATRALGPGSCLADP